MHIMNVHAHSTKFCIKKCTAIHHISLRLVHDLSQGVGVVYNTGLPWLKCCHNVTLTSAAHPLVMYDAKGRSRINPDSNKAWQHQSGSCNPFPVDCPAVSVNWLWKWITLKYRVFHAKRHQIPKTNMHQICPKSLCV